MVRRRAHKTETGTRVRSGFEATVLDDLTERGVVWAYEPHPLTWEDARRGARCLECGSDNTSTRRVYIPDARVAGRKSVWYLEIKGRLTVDDRRTLLGAKREGHDIRLVFMRDNKLTKAARSKRYSAWAEENGFPWAIGRVPEEWVK